MFKRQYNRTEIWLPLTPAAPVSVSILLPLPPRTWGTILCVSIICGDTHNNTVQRTRTTTCAKAESGFDATAAGAGKRVRLAAVPGGTRRHACIVNALAEFRRLMDRQRENGKDGGGGGGSEGSLSGADRPGDKTSVAATANVFRSGIYLLRLWVLVDVALVVHSLLV